MHSLTLFCVMHFTFAFGNSGANLEYFAYYFQMYTI